MSVTAGYKATEVGVIPEDWRVETVRDVLHLRRGRVISHGEITRNPGIYPVYSSQTKNNGVMGYLSTFDFEGDHLSWTTDGANAGTVFFRQGSFNCTNVCGTGRAIVPSETYVEFFAYYLNTVAKNHVSYVGNPKLMSGVFGTIPVVVPTTPEQAAIAEALSDVDEAIAAQQAVIAKKRALKTATMQALLSGTRRLPGLSGEWEEKAIDKICPMQRGFDLPTKQIRGGSVPVVYSNGISAFHDKAMVKGPGIVTGRSGTIGNVHYVEPDFWPHNTSLWVTSFHGNDPRFLLHFLRRLDLSRFASGSGVPTLNRNDFHSFRIKIPDPNEQVAIAEVLTDIDLDMESQQSKLTKLHDLKKGMMQQLLTGKIRLV